LDINVQIISKHLDVKLTLRYSTDCKAELHSPPNQQPSWINRINHLDQSPNSQH